MRWIVLACVALLPLTGLASAPRSAEAQTRSTPVEKVRAVLSQPEAQLDYLEAATTFDQLIDASSNASVTRATVARLVDAARQMAGPKPSDVYKLAAVRKAIYVSGAWNYNRAFRYDLDDPLGTNIRNKMLSTYVRIRKGNCVSMPALFLIVADGIGLKVGLAAAPLHQFVRYTDPAGGEHNLETTSGGHEARLEWYRANLPMSDRAIQSGIYMRTLGKRETIAAMAGSVLDFLIDQRRFQEASDLADVMIAVNPSDAYAMVKKGHASGEMMQAEFVAKYPNPTLIPPPLRARYAELAATNERAFRDAEALGWAEPAKN